MSRRKSLIDIPQPLLARERSFKRDRVPFFCAACPCNLKESLGSRVTPSHLMCIWGRRVSEPKRILRAGEVEGREQ